SEDGDIIDCIDIYQQPAFDHPALRNHKIQLTPSYDVKMETEAGKKMHVGNKNLITQTWHKSGSCPMGTIPVRRAHKNIISKGNSIRDYERKNPVNMHYDKQLNDSKKLHLQLENHSLAILHTEGYAYLGAKGDIKVWNPRVGSYDEYFTSRVALKSGPYYDFEAIESGWAVNPRVYGDKQTRLFVYWTVDASKKTRCFDLTCPGFGANKQRDSPWCCNIPNFKPNWSPISNNYLHPQRIEHKQLVGTIRREDQHRILAARSF
ncbi:hypothetical protein PHJA_002160100, partial [Phtheirospermum japonicum]